MPEQSGGDGKRQQTTIGSGGGTGRGRGGRGNRGRGSCGSFMGAGGACICTRCGQRMPHSTGVPCLEERCPSCGAAMVREGSPHHLEILARRTETATTD